MPIFTSDGNACMNQFENNYNGNGVSAALWRNEIDPSQPGHWGDDATVEETLHTINHVGHVSIYPNVFNIYPNFKFLIYKENFTSIWIKNNNHEYSKI